MRAVWWSLQKQTENYMLKFFRRIRRKLIEEGNLKRYLVYAIGEVLLVMIGILLHQACISRSVPPQTLNGVTLNGEGNKHVQL